MRNITWGADPEGFFKQDGIIRGSEKLIPKRGENTRFGKITRDGVQFELHPTPGTVRELVQNVRGLLLHAEELARDEGYALHYGTVVEVSKAEIESLSKECQVLGCMPSYNVYGEKPITVDASTYRKRSAAGHIHMGLNDKGLLQVREKLVYLMDILVGNTCVLLDRDPDAAERRENYGRAGECRFPRHGVEYRTTSNFWLRDPALMVFTFGLAQMAVEVFADTVHGTGKFWNALPGVIDLDKIRRAIDSNDFELALQNFNNLAPLIRDQFPTHTGYALDATCLGTFVNRAIELQKKGIDAYFPLDRLTQRWKKMSGLDFLSLKF